MFCFLSMPVKPYILFGVFYIVYSEEEALEIHLILYLFYVVFVNSPKIFY